MNTFNQAWKEAIQDIRDHYRDVTIYAFDTHNLFGQFMDNTYLKDGFGNVDWEAILASSSSADTYLFWDDMHPTQKAHQILGEEAFNLINGDTTYDGVPVPEPATLSLLALSGLALIRRKRK